MYNWATNDVLTATKLNPAIVSKAAGDSPYTPSLNDDIILCNCTAGAITINLPTAVGNTKIFNIKKTDSSTNAVTVDGNGTQTIDGDLTLIIFGEGDSYTLISDGANWKVI